MPHPICLQLLQPLCDGLKLQSLMGGSLIMLDFKYLSPGAAHAAFATQGEFTLRFNFPKHFNDPYELFLLPDAELNSIEEKAFYEFLLRELPQAPVTCFSRRPESVVMWAHYCELSSGVCLAIDEEALLSEIDSAFIGDVVYSNDPARIAAHDIRFVCATKKNRHTLFLLASANRAAYLTKRSDWSYECERRMIVPNDVVVETNGMLLATFPSHCLKYLIVGSRATKETRDLTRKWASKSGIEIVEMRYSRRLHDPFFISNGKTLKWIDDRFETSVFACGKCQEPLINKADLCEWCQISEGEKQFAARSNQTMLFLAFGAMNGIPLMIDGLQPRGRLHSQREDNNT
jgi:hypothetical protein